MGRYFFALVLRAERLVGFVLEFVGGGGSRAGVHVEASMKAVSAITSASNLGQVMGSPPKVWARLAAAAARVPL
jgi:predicted RecB family endonuclease